MGSSFIPLAARAAVGLGSLAYTAFSRPRTNSTSTMPVPARRVAGKRVPMRRRVTRVPRQLWSASYKRVATQDSFTMVAGNFKNTKDISLNQLFLDDIRNAYDMYRIKKVTVEIFPQHDPGNGVSGTITNYSVWSACDTTGTFTLASWSNPRELSQFENYKYQSIVGGKRALYTFYPKVSNLVADAGGAAAAAGNYVGNPWLSFSNPGIPHHRLLYEVHSLANTNVEVFSVTYTIHFEVRRAR